MKINIEELAEAVGAKNDWSNLSNQRLEQVEFDSRKIEKGGLFVPLKGAHDGHDFIKAAFENGAALTLSEQPIEEPHLLVEDTLAALQQLAAYVLSQSKTKVIAITGSNGKTTTKDLTAAVLSEKYETYKTQKNYNNEIGLPYTVLHMPEETEMLVLEMGMDRLGDIGLLSNLTKPDFAMITLIGESHLEFFGSREKIAQGKMEITQGLQGPLLAPADSLIDHFLPEKQKTIRFGADSDIFLTKIIEEKNQIDFEVNFLDEQLSVNLPGLFNATNAMLAAYVGHYFGLSGQEIKKGLINATITSNRTQWLKAANGAEILSDIYNANPTAVRLILETFSKIKRQSEGRKIVVLADMLELGSAGAELHMKLADFLNPKEIDELYLYGPLMKNLAGAVSGKFPRLHYYEDLLELKQALLEEVKANDLLLLKGSNGMKLNEVLDTLIK